MNDVPKIHKEDPTVDDHTITFAETGFRIPLSLWGIFSYFPTSKPTHDDLLNPNEVYILSPATWNPHSDAYSANEESMLDWEGKAELYIGLLKEAVRKDMRETNSPMILWDNCVERRARINNLTAKDNVKLHGTTPHTATMAEEGDISSLCQFGWYEWCYYHEHTAAFPNNH